MVMAMMTHKILPLTWRFSRPTIHAKPSSDMMTPNEVNSPILTGKPASFLMTKPTLLAAINNKNSPIPMPAP